MAFTIEETGFTALDIETTGLSPQFCGIVEIAALRFCPDGTSQPFQMLVDPGCSIPRSASLIHGISDSMVRGQPHADEAVCRLLDFVGESPLVLHNAPFDLGFLNPVVKAQKRQRRSQAVFDTLRLSRRIFPGLRSYSLEKLSRFFDFESGGHHRALADCRYCGLLFSKILTKIGCARVMDFQDFVQAYAESEHLLARSAQ